MFKFLSEYVRIYNDVSIEFYPLHKFFIQEILLYVEYY